MINSEGYVTIIIVLFSLIVAVQYSNVEKKTGYNVWKWLLWDFTGLRFIASKINPLILKDEDEHPPATFMLWIIGIYVAFFGVASQRYENRIDIIENRANAIFAQLASNAYGSALGRIPTVQRMVCPEKPDFLSPLTVFRSLFKESRHNEMVDLLKETVEDWKLMLTGINLEFADLKEAKLEGADLNHSILQKANLRDADLTNARLKSAGLNGADLSGALLWEADLTIAELISANLRRAELIEAFLIKANLRGAFLEEADLSGADLSNANLSEAIFREADLSEAKLRGAILTGADLSNADLRGADLTGARLSHADFSGADLSDANLKQVNLDSIGALSVSQLCSTQRILLKPSFL